MDTEVTQETCEGKMYLTLKAKIFPNAEQEAAIAANIEGNRYVYNLMVTYCRLHLQKYGELPGKHDLIRFSTIIWSRMPCIHGMYNNTMHDTADRALRSYRACLDNVKESTDDGSQNHGCGHPRYRTRRSYRSYGYAKGQDFGISRKGKKLYVRLGKVPKKLRLHGPGLPPGTPKTCTVSRDDMGTHFDYYVTITFLQDPGFARDEEYLETDTSSPVGIDVGISNAAAFSDGTMYRNTREYEKSRKRFEKLHSRFSKTLPFTPERDRALSRLNHCYRRLKNKRKDLVDRIVHDAVYLHDGIAMEALSVRQLRSISKSRRMTNQYNDASIGRIRARISDVAASAHRMVILVDPKGTSQQCSRCGTVAEKGLEVRVHRCPSCGLMIDRDINAAINILNRGWTGHPDPVQGRIAQALGHDEQSNARCLSI